MKTDNKILHVQLVTLFEQHPHITSFTYNLEGISFVSDNGTLPISYNQIAHIAIHDSAVDFTLNNDTVYSVSLLQDEVRITLPSIEE